MSRVSIQQFRSRLAVPRAGDGPLVRAYRELARRPDLAAAARMRGWIPWDAAASTDAPRMTLGWAE
ncbi:MAG TPA: hypothetical protein VFT45_11620, partial [Longimicrobium sp.]|nr:hypothetical protein [Longimicrobium sp.]